MISKNTLNKAHYPYTYGDDGGDLELLFKYKKILLVTALALLPINVARKAANAENEVLMRVETSLEEFQRVNECKKRITPISLTFCVISGICLENARVNVRSGNVTIASGLACVAAIALCSGRYLENRCL